MKFSNFSMVNQNVDRDHRLCCHEIKPVTITPSCVCNSNLEIVAEIILNRLTIHSICWKILTAKARIFLQLSIVKKIVDGNVLLLVVIGITNIFKLNLIQKGIFMPFMPLSFEQYKIIYFLLAYLH
jgi:hypothetical protein